VVDNDDLRFVGFVGLTCAIMGKVLYRKVQQQVCSRRVPSECRCSFVVECKLLGSRAAMVKQASAPSPSVRGWN
jgi:hypothetical protein